MIFHREIIDKIQAFVGQFKVLSLTGPRQSGKTTLLKELFTDYTYVNLEDSNMKFLANNDANGFLERFTTRTIIDEAQEAPALFSQLQAHVDNDPSFGQFILSGSQNFLLMQSITQSLAGRVGNLHLLPLSLQELRHNGIVSENINNLIFKGLYPILYQNSNTNATYFYDSYTTTYIERDIRQIRNIENLGTFRRFLKLCAGRVGQELNFNALAVETGISVPTAKSWLSLLETSYVIFLLPPYHKNFNKRITKAPKLYFYDTGLVCNLLNINTPQQLDSFYLRGALFECMIISEFKKRNFHTDFRADLSFWRENNGVEIDLIVEDSLETRAIEIKSGQTITTDFSKNFRLFQKYTQDQIQKFQVIYGGNLNAKANSIDYLSWKRF